MVDQVVNQTGREEPQSGIVETTPEVAATPQSNKYDINIQPLEYGYAVRIGCKSFAYESVEKLLEKLTMYINDPVGTEQAFWNKTLKLD